MKKLSILLFFLIAILSIGSIYYNRKINSFVCEVDCNPDISRALAQMTGTRVRLAPQSVSQFLKSYSKIGSFTIKEKGWGNLEISLVSKKPIFSVKRASWYYHYDWDGRFAEKSKDQQFPTLTAKNLDNEIIKGLRTLFFFAKLETVYTAEVVNRDLVISTPDIKVIFPLVDNYRLLIAKYYYIKNSMLDEIKNNLVVNNKTPITIDLRYQRPIAYK